MDVFFRKVDIDMIEIIYYRDCEEKIYKIIAEQISEKDFKIRDDIIRERNNLRYQASHYKVYDEWQERMIVKHIYNIVDLFNYKYSETCYELDFDSLSSRYETVSSSV